MKKILILILIFIPLSLYSGEWRITGFLNAIQMRTLNVTPDGDLFFWNEGVSDTRRLTIMKTSDRGISWSNVLRIKNTLKDTLQGYCANYLSRPIDMYVVDNNVMYFFFKESRLFLKTTDGGDNWNVKEMTPDVPLGSEENYKAERIGIANMIGDGKGIVGFVGWRGYFHTTSDDFATIDTIIVSKDSVAYNSIEWFDDTFIVQKYKLEYHQSASKYFKPDYFSLYKSTDRGKTWKEYPNTDSVLCRQIDFIDENLGFMWGGKRDPEYPESNYLVSVLYRTTDGGESWENLLFEKDSSYSVGLDEFVYLDSLNYITNPHYSKKTELTGISYQYFYHTTDAGKSWTIQHFDKDISNGEYTSIDYWTGMDCLKGYSPDNVFCMLNDWIASYFPDGNGVLQYDERYKKQFNIYPNPAKTGEEINIEPTGNISVRAEIKIYTIRGELMESFGAYFLGGNSIQFVLDNSYPPGTYVISIEIPGQPPAYEMIVIE